MDNRHVYIKVEGNGGAPADIYAHFMDRLIFAYRSLTYLERILDPKFKGETLYYSLSGSYYVYPPDTLRMTSVRLESPGFWEFLGNINPLETIRKYLNDRHERKRDNSYRSSTERVRLQIENDILRLDFVQKAINIAKEIGYTDEEIKRLIKENALIPLMQLDAFQDRDIISTAETRVIEEKEDA